MSDYGKAFLLLQIIIGNGDRICQIIILYVYRFQCVHGMVERCCRLEHPVPHTGAYLRMGTVVIPEEKTGAPAVTIAQFVLVPHFPNALAVDSTNHLAPTGKLLDIPGFTIMIRHFCIDGCHQMESASVHIVPCFLVHRPEVLGRHHFA